MATFSAVSIVTHNMGEAIEFYSHIGLRLATGSPTDDHAEFEGDGVRIMLDTEDLIAQLDSTWQRPKGGHAIALAFRCATPKEVDDLFETLVNHGAEPRTQPWDAFWGQRYASVLDPDRNQIDLFCEL